jgi:two-component system, cell cycle response regulator
MKKILIIDDEPVIRELLKVNLEKNGYEAITALDGTEGIKKVDAEKPQLILLDLNLPETKGLETVKKFIQLVHSRTPIIVLTAMNDDKLGMQAIQLGAEDYLVKGQYDTKLLLRTIKYSIERNLLKQELVQMSLLDDLTGLYNRRGFKTLIEQQVKEARRSKKPLVLFLIDIDQMKQINDQFGHLMGDTAIKDTANLIKRSFRESDIVSRWGGDEFIVLGVDTLTDSISIIKKRLQNNLQTYNANNKQPFKLSLSIGDVIKQCDSPNSLEELIEEADQKMYQHKKSS